MPAQAAKMRPDPRFTKPKPRVRDARAPQLYDPQIVSEIRQELTGHRLQLEGYQLSAMPRDLGELAYQCDAPEVTRKRLADRAQQKGQGTLLEAPRYKHEVIVTDLDWTPRRVWAFYNRRVRVESILKESALGFGMDHLPSGRFAGNGLFRQLLILAYNYVNVFRRLCLPEQRRRRYVQGLRRVLLAVPGWVERGTEALKVHCSERAELLPAVLGMVVS